MHGTYPIVFLLGSCRWLITEFTIRYREEKNKFSDQTNITLDSWHISACCVCKMLTAHAHISSETPYSPSLILLLCQLLELCQFSSQPSRTNSTLIFFPKNFLNPQVLWEDIANNRHASTMVIVMKRKEGPH